MTVSSLESARRAGAHRLYALCIFILSLVAASARPGIFPHFEVGSSSISDSGGFARLETKGVGTLAANSAPFPALFQVAPRPCWR